MFRKFYLRPAPIARYSAKVIRKPSVMVNIVRAGLDVVKYSMGGYLGSKFRHLFGSAKQSVH